MSINKDQAMLLVEHWQNARKRKAENEGKEVRVTEDAPEVKVSSEPDQRPRSKTQEEIILHSYLSGASEARISRISKIPIETVREVIAKGNV